MKRKSTSGVEQNQLEREGEEEMLPKPIHKQHEIDENEQKKA